jgi:hypothetical protein
MRWQFKVSLFLLLMSWSVFLVLAAYDTIIPVYYPVENVESSMIGFLGVWLFFEHWSISLGLSLAATVLLVFGLGLDIKVSGWKLTDFIKIEIIDDEDDIG